LQILKDLENDSEGDPRSYAEKLQELLANSGTDEAAAIASRFILEKARDQEGLPDYSLQALYTSQSNPDLKRVIAQVLSQRGNDSLLNSYIAETQGRLASSQPTDRLEALSRLGKLHSTRAVNAIAPFLQDSDTTVRLAALFALRDSGNQQQVGLVENMIHDPDPSVSTLADSVANSLRNLSSRAHTSYSRSDIEAELPPIANP
jgi:HEAT repeat protein